MIFLALRQARPTAYRPAEPPDRSTWSVYVWHGSGGRVGRLSTPPFSGSGFLLFFSFFNPEILRSRRSCDGAVQHTVAPKPDTTARRREGRTCPITAQTPSPSPLEPTQPLWRECQCRPASADPLLVMSNPRLLKHFSGIIIIVSSHFIYMSV